MAAPAGRYAAIVIGSTGAVGREVVRELTDRSACTRVVALVRNPVSESEIPNKFPGLDLSKKDKLEVRVVDYDNLGDKDFELPASSDEAAQEKVAFCCLGTTRADAGSAEAFKKVDLDYVSKAASLSLSSGVRQFALVSAQNASSSSFFLYPKTKGQAEDYVTSLKFPHLTIARPGLIDRGNLARTVEKIASYVMSPISTATIARGMIKSVEDKLGQGESSPLILWNKELRDLSSKL